MASDLGTLGVARASELTFGLMFLEVFILIVYDATGLLGICQVRKSQGLINGTYAVCPG